MLFFSIYVILTSNTLYINVEENSKLLLTALYRLIMSYRANKVDIFDMLSHAGTGKCSIVGRIFNNVFGK